jgi:uncharacterized protein RhaS with RHS repeats
LTAEYNGTVTGNGRVYVTADHLGSTRLVTDSQGGVVERHDYEPFGVELLATAGSLRENKGFTSAGSPLKFTGKERDAESGLDYFQTRYMSSRLLKFSPNK